jgi:hypothetical protein
MNLSRFVLSLGVAFVALTGCAHDLPPLRQESAQRIAMPVFMLPRDIAAGDFMLQSYERVYQRFEPATLYIEGDGVPYTSETLDSTNPTPTDPIALRLAAQDGGANVIWLGRPCQYNEGWRNGKDCPKDYWTGKRFSPEVIESFHAALDNIKKYYAIPSFRLVGYDGGAAIATILAAERDDVTALQTVAGNLNHRTVSQIHNTEFLDGSLNPVDFAAKLSAMPQRHFLGKLDGVTPPAVYNDFAQAVGDGSCMNVTLVDNADHEHGWTEQWKILKDMPLDCGQPAEPVKFDPTPLSGDKYKTKG